jgi:hypothetical protein
MWPSDKLTSKINFLPHRKQTCPLQMTTRFVLGKVITVDCPEASETSTCDRDNAACLKLAMWYTNSYLCALFRFQQAFCSNLFVLYG